MTRRKVAKRINADRLGLRVGHERAGDPTDERVGERTLNSRYDARAAIVHARVRGNATTVGDAPPMYEAIVLAQQKIVSSLPRLGVK